MSKQPLKSMMTDVAPINAMPSDKTLNKVQLAANVAKHIPHPVAQKAGHIADAAVKGIKQVKQSANKVKAKRKVKSPVPE